MRPIALVIAYLMTVSSLLVMKPYKIGYRRACLRLLSSIKASPESRPDGFPEALLPPTIPSWYGVHQDIKKLIVYRDSDLIVVYKPNGLLTCQENAPSTKLPSTKPKASATPVVRSNLLDMLQRYFDEGIRDKNKRPKVGLVHRLDSPSSGLVVFSLTKAALQSLNEAFRSREVSKQYLCVVNGEISSLIVCNDHLLKTSSSITKVIANPGNRTDVVPASLTVRPLYTVKYTVKPSNSSNPELPSTTSVVDADGKKQTLCEVTLLTGRKHQIRAQLAYRLHPLVGDVKYGAPQKFLTKDIALHAHKLEFVHPRTEKPMKFLCPPPRVWSKRFGEDCMLTVDALLQQQ